jgi:serine/threonine-protein kinase RsbT
VGLAPRAQWEASIVASELATNVLKYGGHGTLTLRHVQTPREALVLEVADEGDGIADIGSALIDGYSGGTQLLPDRRRNGQGLGVGLGTVHRLSDEVTIDSAPGRGTRVVVWKYLRK